MNTFVGSLLIKTAVQVGRTLAADWPYLALSAVIAALLKVHLDAERVSAFLQRHRRTGVVAATAVAVATPLCSCGTTAVVLGMMASLMPWAPIVAFMVASPLSSPQELVYSAGLFGWRFALAFFAASIALGLVGGLAASVLDKRGWLANQARYLVRRCCEGSAEKASTVRAGARQVFGEALCAGGRLLVMFLAFAFIGDLLNGLIPSMWVATAFGSGRFYSVPLAATLGLPFYINTETSLPLVRSMLDAGMSQGAALAFLIAGAGTSLGAISGALTIARWRVITLVVATLWLGAIATGLAFDALLTVGLI